MNLLFNPPTRGRAAKRSIKKRGNQGRITASFERTERPSKKRSWIGRESTFRSRRPTPGRRRPRPSAKRSNRCIRLRPIHRQCESRETYGGSTTGRKTGGAPTCASARGRGALLKKWKEGCLFRARKTSKRLYKHKNLR